MANFVHILSSINKMINKVRETIEEFNMFNNGDKVIVAVSGGPDSMCLLHILYTIRKELNLHLAVAHLNHCLRGEDADSDEEYVKNFCKENQIEFYSKRVKVHEISKKNNVSCETAGREERYKFFYELKDKLNADKIAIAHNANDQAETILMRLMRGAGLEGVCGIKPVRDSIIVRPILKLTRKEIENYCKINSINPKIDKTNLDNVFSRNKIRLDLIPYIEKNFNKDIINTLNRFADLVRTDNKYLENIAKNKYEEYCFGKNSNVIINKKLFLEDNAIVSRVIRYALNILNGGLYNIEFVHIYDIMDIQKKDTGKTIKLPHHVIASNNYGDIILSKENNISITDNYKLDLKNENEKYFIKSKNLYIKFNIENIDFNNNFRKNRFIKYFDYDKVKGDIIIRYRKDGDKFNPIGMNGTKKLKDIFIDLKIPRNERNNIPLLCFGDDIAYIWGYRISNKFKIDNNTKRILKVEISRF